MPRLTCAITCASRRRRCGPLLEHEYDHGGGAERGDSALCAAGAHVRITEAIIFLAAALGGIGGLVGFWGWADSIEFVVRVRICRLSDGARRPERRPDGAVAHLTIGYKPLAQMYSPPCEVHLPSAVRWDSATPSWARGRRKKSSQHRQGHGHRGRAGEMHFVDAPGNHHETSCASNSTCSLP